MERKVDSEKEVHFEAVDLRNQHSTNFGVVGVVVIGIIKEFRRQQHSANDNTMDIQFCQEKVVALNQSINIYQSQDEALVRTRRVLVNSAIDPTRTIKQNDEQPTPNVPCTRSLIIIICGPYRSRYC